MRSAPRSQSAAQREADRVVAFREELDELARRGVLELTAEQRGRFDAWADARLAELAHEFDVDTTSSEKRVSWGLRIASTLGGIALCAAAVTFFLHVWGYLDTPVQVVVLALAPVIALAGTELAARRERTLYFASLMSLVTLACFITNLAVLGRIFNITSSENALLAWGAFALLVAYRYGLRLQLFLGLILVIGYGVAMLTARLGHHWLDFDRRPEHIAIMGVAMFVLPSFLHHERRAEFPAVYRLVGSLAYFVAILSLCEWGKTSYLPFDAKTVELGYELLGLASAAGAIALGIVRQWDGVVNTGSVFFVIFLYCRLYHWWWDVMPKYAFFAVIGAIAIVLAIAFKRVRERLKLSGEGATVA
jgi:uncharacterized membrane protein